MVLRTLLHRKQDSLRCEQIAYIDKQVYPDIQVSDNRTVSAIHCADSTIGLKTRICPNPDGDAEVEDEDNDGSDQ